MRKRYKIIVILDVIFLIRLIPALCSSKSTFCLQLYLLFRTFTLSLLIIASLVFIAYAVTEYLKEANLSADRQRLLIIGALTLWSSFDAYLCFCVADYLKVVWEKEEEKSLNDEQIKIQSRQTEP